MNRSDLASVWDRHTADEFQTRDTEATLATMVADAYVNHVPVMTGGSGKDELRRFYAHDFISMMPADTTLHSISRTIGVDQLVDEMIFFIHAFGRDAVDAARHRTDEQARPIFPSWP